MIPSCPKKLHTEVMNRKFLTMKGILPTQCQTSSLNKNPRKNVA